MYHFVQSLISPMAYSRQYNGSRNNATNGPRQDSRFGGRPGRGRPFNGGSRGRKQPAKLDPRFYINKAVSQPVDTTPQEEITVTFADFALEDIIKRNIRDHGYITPTPIQAKSIPVILEGKDVIGIANTGTGKTAAFLLPLINKVWLDPRQRVLIVTPTRELALQIVEEFLDFSHGTRLNAVLCIGGANLSMQEKKLRERQPQFVIGTPGRLKDLIERRTLNLGQFHNIVLDEVDRMVDIGFIKDIQYLISLLPPTRHSLFFSATITDNVRSILNQFVHSPVTISVKTRETNSSIDQDIIHVPDSSKKVEILHDLLIQDGFEKVLVFGRTKWGIEKLTKMLLERGFKAASIHGNKSQNQRQRALEQFKHNQLQVLLATDVASRGLDIEDVTHVINYDEPASYEDYVHRIGRTGRANKKGFALTFVEH